MLFARRVVAVMAERTFCGVSVQTGREWVLSDFKADGGISRACMQSTKEKDMANLVMKKNRPPQQSEQRLLVARGPTWRTLPTSMD